MHLDLPDKFQYDINSPPLHVVGSLEDAALDEVARAAAQCFYGFIKKNLTRKLEPGTMLENGETLEEFAMKHILTNSLRRKTSAAKRKQEATAALNLLY